MSETTCLLCGIETDGMYHQCVVRVSARRRPMYQIYLVIKEDRDQEVSSMLISGHEEFDDAADEIVNCFDDIQFCLEQSREIGEIFPLGIPVSP